MPSPSNALPSHLETLVPFEWGIWRWFVLRGAGFPSEQIERLGQPHCAQGRRADLGGRAHPIAVAKCNPHLE